MTITSPLVDETTRFSDVDYLARARDVARIVESEADAIESVATITKPVVDALTESNLFWMLIPTE